MIATINPMTGETVREYPALSASELETRLRTAWRAFERYRATSFEARAGHLARAAELLEADRDRLARLMAIEMGKPVRQGAAEVEKCAWACRYYAEGAARMLAPESIATDAARSYVRYDPLGPVLAVMPWNFPLWQVLRFAAPALMAGNVVLLKHASNVPGCALAIEEIFSRAGVREGRVPDAPRRDGRGRGDPGRPPRPGRDADRQHGRGERGRGARRPAHQEDGARARRERSLRRDADRRPRPRRGGRGVTARTINNGQSCIAAKRFIVHEDAYDAFRRAVHPRDARARDRRSARGAQTETSARSPAHRLATPSRVRSMRRSAPAPDR
jgi:succinate-semialdehyde dehydrogenase / glutarate-semialdehyde dehydrogenase